MKKPIPEGRVTSSREAYWKGLFNQFSQQQEEHAISGWSPQGLRLRMQAYVCALPSLNLAPGSLVLDLGCGPGSYTRMLGAGGFRVVGVDFAWMVAAGARKRASVNGVDYVAGDATSLPFGEGVFDHVVCIGLFQSLERYEQALAEIKRVLKPGGVLCLMTLNRRFVKCRLDRLRGREEMLMVDGSARPRLSTYDPHQFAQTLRQTGFAVTSLRPVQVYPEKLNRLEPLIRVWNRLPVLKFETARSFMVIATKG